MKVTYHPAVQKDINEALKYYRKTSDKLADDFWDELIDAIEHTRLNPKSNPP